MICQTVLLLRSALSPPHMRSKSITILLFVKSTSKITIVYSTKITENYSKIKSDQKSLNKIAHIPFTVMIKVSNTFIAYAAVFGARAFNFDVTQMAASIFNDMCMFGAIKFRYNTLRALLA